MKLLLVLLVQNIKCGKLKFSSEAESELEHLREVFDKISDDITNSTEKENFEIYAKTLEEEIKIMHDLPVDHGPGHLHVKYLPDSIIEILHIFHPDPFDAAYKHHLLDHLSPEAAIESYNLYHNRTEVKNGSIGPDLELIKQNTIWHSQLLASPDQQGFLRKIHEIPNTLLVVHDTVTHMMQNSNLCWVLMTIDSIVGDEDEIALAKKVGAAFYERCSVGYVDVSYPSNYDLFKNFTMDGGTGWLIGKYPGAEIIASDYQSDTWRFELYNIEYWGKSIPGQLVKEFPAQIVKGLAAEIYELMMDDEQKIEAIFHYDDPNKDLMKAKIHHYKNAMYKYIWKKTSEDIKNGVYRYADEKYLKYFMMYERKFKKTQSLRDFMEQDDEYPKEIFGDQQVMRLNPRPIHYEF